jgi:predicted DNA-binding transcriptional regulator YafY
MTVSNEKNSMDRTYDRLRTVRVRNSRETHVSMDTPARLLRLLVLFSSRASWRADELTAKLEVTERTLRRDVVRLRDLGYPIESTTGPYGGYALGAGGRLPPLLLDDDEAVAVSVGLREVSHTADPMIGAAAVSALTKLAQVLPSGLRERVDTLGEVTVGIAGPQDRWSTPTDGAPSLEVGVLMLLAEACRRGRRLRFDYTTGDDRAGRRHVDPYRLVSVRRRWYLVAFDLDRDDWRTFRVDRITGPAATGARTADRDAPDAAALVAEGVAVRAYDVRARIRIHAPRADVAEVVGPTVGVIEPSEDPASTIVQIGGDADWIARYLAGLPFTCEVLETPEVRRELRALARRLLRDTPR